MVSEGHRQDLWHPWLEEGLRLLRERGLREQTVRWSSHIVSGQMPSHHRETGIVTVSLVAGVIDHSRSRQNLFSISVMSLLWRRPGPCSQLSQGPWPWSLTTCWISVVTYVRIGPLGFWHNETSVQEAITLWGMEVRVQKSCTTRSPSPIMGRRIGSGVSL
jgi:hypothetical protein